MILRGKPRVLLYDIQTWTDRASTNESASVEDTAIISRVELWCLLMYHRLEQLPGLAVEFLSLYIDTVETVWRCNNIQNSGRQRSSKLPLMIFLKCRQLVETLMIDISVFTFCADIEHFFTCSINEKALVSIFSDCGVAVLMSKLRSFPGQHTLQNHN